MKFEVDRDALLRPIQLVTGVVERRQTLPVLSNVLFRVDEDGVLTLTGTDLEVELIARVRLDPGSRPGETTLPARKLSDIWRSLGDGARVTIEQDGDRARIRSGRSRFSLATLPAADYPALEPSPTDVEFALGVGKFRRLLERTGFAMAQQDVRYFLNGMLLEVTPTHVRTVATDGHRLAMATLDEGVSGTEGRQAIIPRKGVIELQRLISDHEGEASISLGSSFLRVSVGDYSLSTKLVDGKFPDYDRVVPRGGQIRVTADRDALKGAFSRAAILSNEKYRGVRLAFDADVLTIQANNPEQEEAEETVSIEFNGEPLEIGFNVAYLQDVLSALTTEQVRLCLTDSNGSALMEGVDETDCVYVVMPMRL